MSKKVLLCVLGLGLALICHAQDSPQVFLDLHNAARRAAGVGPLQWNSSLEAYARKYANQRNDCQLIHSEGPYGENIYWGYGEGFMDAEAAVRYWVDEKDYYDYNTNSCLKGKDCLHYTQIVWKNSKNLGCASSHCSNGGMFTTCNYYPPGNYVGERPY